MEKVSPKLDILRDKLIGYLEDGLGQYVEDREGDFSIFYESVRVFVCPREWTDGKTIVRIFSITNLDVMESAALFKFLATENFKLLMGHFSYDEENLAVWFEHVLLGEEMSKEELLTALSTVAILADKYDDIIKQKFGGILYTEA